MRFHCLQCLHQVGVQCIVDLFNLIPYMREHFKTVIADSGRMDPDDDAAMQAMLENHAKLVMNIVHQVVINIDDLDLISPKLFRIGVFHKNTGIVPRYLDIMGPVFCNAVRPILLKHRMWRAEIEDSWMEVFKVITSIMKRGYQGAEESLPMELALAPTEKCVIVATWHSIFLKHMTSMGKTLFIDMFKVDPNILQYFDAFKESGIEDLALNRQFQGHGQRVMNLVKFVVDNIDNPAKLTEHLLILGNLHVKKKINPKFLDLMGPTFCQAIRWVALYPKRRHFTLTHCTLQAHGDG